MLPENRLVLIGNGFDLAHGLKTTYKDFIDWYICQCFNQFCNGSSYSDNLIELRYKYAGTIPKYPKANTLEDVLSLMSTGDYQKLSYKSIFLQKLINSFLTRSWINIECYYFQRLKQIFNGNDVPNQKREEIIKLNQHFNFIIQKLTEYIETVNSSILNCKALQLDSRLNIYEAFRLDESEPVTFVNFNYTDTLTTLGYANDDEVIHIHGRVSDVNNNPIIFGYGDETDPTYQKIEDSGENVYLEHIKSFGYLNTDNYSKLISKLESGPYIAYIVGHSCGLSDRILLNEIFEHKNCQKIEIFYHKQKSDTDNFKEITQEISRHFKPQNKGLMRKKISFKNPKNIIPQNPKL